jgi:hypothetical protein
MDERVRFVARLLDGEKMAALRVAVYTARATESPIACCLAVSFGREVRAGKRMD